MLTGYSYPFCLDGFGNLRLSSGALLVLEHVAHIIETEYNGRVMYPSYTARPDVHDALDMPRLVALMKIRLDEYVPEVDFDFEYKYDQETGTMRLWISCKYQNEVYEKFV